MSVGADVVIGVVDIATGADIIATGVGTARPPRPGSPGSRQARSSPTARAEIDIAAMPPANVGVPITTSHTTGAVNRILDMTDVVIAAHNKNSCNEDFTLTYKAITTASLLAVLASGALAQTGPKSDLNAPMQKMGDPINPDSSAQSGRAGSNGIKMGDKASSQAKFIAISESDIMASRLIGADVFNNANEDVGQIQDVMLKEGNHVIGVIVSVGGYLGFNERYIALEPSTVSLSQKDGAWRAHVDATKDALSKAPEFKYPKNQS